MNIPLAEYVFNLQHNREQIVEAPSLGKLLNEKQIGNILSYLHYNVSYKLMGVSKKWHEGFKKGADYIVQEILKEIFFLKLQARERLSKRIPVLFENDIFSDYFLMLDDILNLENCKEGSKDSSNFLSKEQLNDIKNIKIETDVIKSVAKVICIILGEKPDRKTLATGEIKTLYLEKLKMMVLNGQLTKLMKNVNKLDINLTKINTISEELSQYIPKLEEVKKTNRGVYQLLIWELMVYECLKTYNPFDFISSEYITNRFETDEVEIVKYYCEIMNYLKYNLKIKFKLCGSFQLKKLYDNLKKYLNEQKMSLDLVDDSNSELNKIAKIYFESKDIIPLGAKPALYERMFNEIIKISSKIIQDTPSSEASAIYNVQEEGLGVIKEENSVHGSNINLGRVMISPGHQSMNIQLNKSYQREMNKIQLLCNFKNKKSSSVTFSDIPQEVIIKHMLFYLDINSLPKFALCSKKTNETIKTHIFIRLFFLNKEKKLIEQENFDLIASVEEKRKRFFEEYEIDPPSKDHSCQLMNIITSDDIIELKQCFKKYNKNYENIISPLVLLLGGKVK